MSNSLSCFKAYDIRGRVPGVLNAPLARALGQAVVEILGAKSVVIGRDARLSGPELLERFYRRWPQLQPVTGAAFGDGPAVYYSAPGWRGSIGLIAAVHGKFCASCNRVRLTSQGFLRPCLASESGTDLRALLRSGADDAALLQAIQNTILAKPREHHFGQGSMPATRGMYRIGG